MARIKRNHDSLLGLEEEVLRVKASLMVRGGGAAVAAPVVIEVLMWGRIQHVEDSRNETHSPATNLPKSAP
mgnify:CR=1 FL=1